jgi:membrane-bound serine protease (ClpP class)
MYEKEIWVPVARRDPRLKETSRWLRGYAPILCLLYVLLGLQVGQVQAQTPPSVVHVLQLSGVINPPSADYVERALSEAAAQQAHLVIIELDTPGGLESSMRVILRAILASPVPVVVYVTPSGAHAASAGLFVLAASHVAAMTPGTNTGAAHPVGLGGEADEVMSAKVVNDAAATIRSLAAERGRNVEWVERAVRESVSITEREALELGVIEIVAQDRADLLAQIDGQSVVTVQGEVTIDVTGASLQDAPMNLVERLLHVISHPDIAFVLLSLGSIAILAEMYNPGAFVPGIIGALSLIIAFFALGNLPTNWAGVALMVLAAVLLVAELNTDGTGVLGGGAVVAFLLGGLFLFQPFRGDISPSLPVLRVSPWLLGSVTAGMGALVFLVMTQVARTRKAPLRTGKEKYVGQVVRVHEDLDPRGRVWFQGQTWFASVRGARPVPAGQQVRIVDLEGLVLIVEPINPPGVTDDL